jgi:hypothetical protein
MDLLGRRTSCLLVGPWPARARTWHSDRVAAAPGLLPNPLPRPTSEQRPGWGQGQGDGLGGVLLLPNPPLPTG